jgi:hypothetical protein
MLRAALSTLVVGGLLLGLTPVRGEPPTVVRVQEDWELVVGDASAQREAPQVVTVLSPFNSEDGVYGLFELNHQSLPSYQQGGMQLQVWNGEELVGFKDNARTDLLGQEGEVVTWTQEMSVAYNSVLRFRILDGQSTTWGEFAPEGTLYLNSGVSLDNLNAYSPDSSVGRSGVSFGANRVQSLVLKRVRLYSNEGLIAEDSTPRPVALDQ